MNLITPELGIIFWQTVTFLTVLFILSKYAWRPILKVIKEREDAVAGAIQQIYEAQALMEQVTNDRAKLLKEANLERERMIHAALDMQKEIIERTHQEALTAKEQLLTEARMKVAQEEQRAFALLKHKLGFLAIQMAEQLLRKELNKEQAQMEFIERLTRNQPSTTA